MSDFDTIATVPHRQGRPRLDELRRRVGKPAGDHFGNWMARRIARPLALRITWVIAPWPVSAHAATLAALFAALASSAAFATGSTWGWMVGAVLWQLWYLLDHVDGQLARLHGSASLDGVTFDYLMHHLVNVTVPCSIGFGLSMWGAEPLWFFVGLAWAMGLLTIGVHHDARYKAFIQRLKWVQGELRVRGAGGFAPAAATQRPRALWRLVRWLFAKACEPHVVMNLVTGASVATHLFDDTGLTLGRATATILAAVAVAVAAARLSRALRDESAEREFARWFQPPPGHDLIYREGRWYSVPVKRADELASTTRAVPATSSAVGATSAIDS